MMPGPTLHNVRLLNWNSCEGNWRLFNNDDDENVVRYLRDDSAQP